MKDNIFDLIDKFKVVVFLPKKNFSYIIDELHKYEVNKLGNYINCMSWCEVTSTWTPIEGAKPFLGKVGEKSVEQEIRLEFICEKSKLKEITELLKRLHPYEEAEIDIIPLL